MSRKIIPFIVAFVLICLVMVVAGVFSFSGLAAAEKFNNAVAWSQPYSTAESMKVIDLTGDGQDELFIQNQQSVTAFNGDGSMLWSFNYSYAKTTLGDFNGDGTEDVIVFHSSGVDVITNGQATPLASALSIGSPSRVALIRFTSGPQIVLGDSSGGVLALSVDGTQLWQSSVGSTEIRGMDDARIGGEVHVAIASNDGTVKVFASDGSSVWTVNQEQLRRMRAFDLNADGNSEIITGGEYGAFRIYNAENGQVIFEKALGQAVSEVREVELNGEPSSREIVAGGKDGGIWAFSFDGATATQMWTGSLSDKVTEISGLDINEDGKQEAVI
ncbi:MAG: PQQ-binding-like beta-propeller repeat protein, partial [Anaerolineales bacterium]|nr:PQQ-binding-like beta-propeller repeat protein [Anaerolineales bacterium]